MVSFIIMVPILKCALDLMSNVTINIILYNCIRFYIPLYSFDAIFCLILNILNINILI